MDGIRKTSPPRSPQSSPRPFVLQEFEAPISSPPRSLPKEGGPQKPVSFWKIGGFIFFLVLLILFGGLFFLGSAGFQATKNIRLENKNLSFLSQFKHLASVFLSEKRVPLQGEEEGRVNILLLGRAGERYPGRNLTDTVMVMSLDTKRGKVALLSLPRDLYAPIPDTGLYTKINSMYQYGLGRNEGVEPMRQAIEHITGLPLHYFVILDFDGFEKAVDTLGGIRIEVLRDFYDPRYPGKNYSYETFEIKKGWQTLDGATALKYVRERHADPEGDFGRAKRQQQVIQAIKEQTLSSGTLFNVFTVHNLIETLGESVKTDMETEDIGSLIELSKTLDTKNVTSVVIDAWKKESLLRVSHVQVGPVRAFALVPRTGNWNEIKDVSEHLFELDTLKKRQAEIASEEPTVTIFTPPEDFALAEKLRRLLEGEMGFASVSITSLPSAFARLENRSGESIIVDRTNLQKPYSLDELLKKFSLKKEVSLPEGITMRDETDFVLVLGEDLIEALSFDEAEDPSALQTDKESSAFPEVLPPQPKPEKKKK